MYKLHGQVSQKSFWLRMRDFQGIVFIWKQTNREIFKSALVYQRLKYFVELYISGSTNTRKLVFYRLKVP